MSPHFERLTDERAGKSRMDWPKFEDVDLGDEIGVLEIEATDDAVTSFCQVWGNPIPNRFTSPEAAAAYRTSRSHRAGNHGYGPDDPALDRMGWSGIAE